MLKERRTRILIFCIVILSGTVIALVSPSLPRSGIIETLGINLAASGVIAILLDLILRDEVLDDIKQELQSSVRELGIGQAVAPEYVRAFREAGEHIDIIAISFTMGAQAYQQLILNKIIDEHCHIRVLIVDPDSKLLDCRARDEPDKNGDRIRQKIKDTWAACEKLQSAYRMRVSFADPPKGSFRLKTHQGIPYFGYSRMDDKAFLTPYMVGEYGINLPVIEVREHNSALFKSLEKHFETLWEREDSRLVFDLGFVGMREADSQAH